MRHLLRTIPAVVVLLAVLSAACGGTGSDRAAPAGGAGEPWALALQPLPMPFSSEAAEPFLSVSGRGVLLSWIDLGGSTATLRFAERTSDGWSEPRTVASGDNWFVNSSDVPSVIRLSRGTLVAHWYTNTDPRLEAYDLWLSYSDDEGRSWSAPFTPHDDGTTTQHGFATLFELPSGQGLGVVWLDGRAMAQDAASADGAAMSLRFAAYDTRWTKTADLEIDGRVCECCTTSVAVTGEGPVVAFRDRSLREIRDIHVSRLDGDAWTYPRPVFVDNWRINACPVNGPALDAEGRRAAVAWFTVKDDRPQAYAAFSDDAGRTWGDPIRLDDVASRGLVGIDLLDGEGALASWVELADQRSRFHVRRIDPSGARSAVVDVTGGAAVSVSGHPRMARHGAELILVWTESSADGSLQVKGASAQVPH